MKTPPKKRIPKTVVALGWASFFTDFSSEMIYPLMPVFLTTVLGAGAVALGVIEGIAETTASMVKWYSGILADKMRRKKTLVMIGYGLAGLVRPLIGLATVWPFVLAMRFLDRVGKGIRTSPRDALIADAVTPEIRGRAYGFHRAMDHAGAVVGPLVAAALLLIPGFGMRNVFLVAVIPAIVVMFILIYQVKEKPAPVSQVQKAKSTGLGWTHFNGTFKYFLLVLLIFTLGNSTDAFLLLRLKDVGVSVEWIALLWAGFHVVKMVCTYYGGILSDKVGRKVMILSGWVVYAVVYLLFARISTETGLIAVFLSYGIYFGLTEPVEKAWVADLVPVHLRGTAFGYYNGVIGLAALPASLFFGLLYQKWGATVAFGSGAGLATLAAVLLVFIGTPSRKRD